MQVAVEKGFMQAIGDWRQQLTSICKDTFDVTDKLFNGCCDLKVKQTEI